MFNTVAATHDLKLFHMQVLHKCVLLTLVHMQVLHKCVLLTFVRKA